MRLCTCSTNPMIGGFRKGGEHWSNCPLFVSSSEASQPPGDHCRRCDRKGFELFLVSFYNGYGRDGDNTLERWVCRDCRAQVGEQVRVVFEKADPNLFKEGATNA